MPNDHVMCFKVWNELYACLTHNHPYDLTDVPSSSCMQDSSYHGYSDDITDDEQQSTNIIQHSSLYTMDVIQKRLHHLLDHPEEEKLLLGSINAYPSNQDAVDDHTSSEGDADSRNQVMLFTSLSSLY